MSQALNLIGWIAETAENCGVSSHQIRQWIFNGLLPYPEVFRAKGQGLRVLSPPLTALPPGLPPKRGAPLGNQNSSRLRRMQKKANARTGQSVGASSCNETTTATIQTSIPD